MIDMTRALILTALLCGLTGCGGNASSGSSEQARGGEEVRDDIYLRFGIDGDGFDLRRFEPSFGTGLRARNVNYWMAYQDREETTFHMESDSEEWEIDVDFKIPAEALGTYPFEPDELDSNRDFFFRLRNPDAEDSRQYYAQRATVELTEYDGDYISGTFEGRFFRGSLTNPDDREFVTISDGEFRVNWAEGQSNTNKARWPE